MGTLTRVCGRDHLQQMLPHFGEGNQDELKDYVEMESFHEKEAESEKKHILKGLQGVGKYDYLYGQRKAKYVSGAKSTTVKYGNDEVPETGPAKSKPNRSVFAFGGTNEQNKDEKVDDSASV